MRGASRPSRRRAAITTPTDTGLGAAPRRAVRVLATLVVLACVAGLAGLGVWQVERRAWKLDLIERVEARIHADPAPPPGPAEWPSVTAERDAYRRVVLTGTYLDGRDTLVQAVTELGGGFWVMTPLRTDIGTVLVNRGFAAAGRTPAPPEPGETRVTGLLRVSEPGGAFLRANDPAAGRWYSRDVAAIGAARGLSDLAPYFVDADARPSARADEPVGGLTVVRFPNSHLVYALTWFALAGMLAAVWTWVLLGWRRRAGRA